MTNTLMTQETATASVNSTGFCQNRGLETIGDRATGVAHDFNNVLQAILGYASLSMTELPCDSKAYGYMEKTVASATRGMNLVRQILDVSRGEEQQVRPTQIKFAVLEALDLLHNAIPENVQIRTVLDPECPPVGVDSTELIQLVMNLCSNGLHAMSVRGGVLTVRLRETKVSRRSAATSPRVAPGRYASLTVRDTGHGMDAETQNCVFDRFFTTKRPGQGTGLGLHTVGKIVKKCGGTISIDSKPGKGTTFQILFPLVALTS